MTFFAGRRNGGTGNSDDRPGVPSANGPSANGPANDSTGLPPWVESAVRKLLASVLPQFQPLVEKTEAVLTEAHESLAGLKRDQAAVLLELVALRRVVIGMQVQLAVDTAPPAVTVKRLPESGAKLRHERGVLGASDDA